MKRPTPKRSHKAVHYGRGMDKAHCGICAHFRAPDACELVRSPVSRTGWCELFKKREA